MLFVSEWINKEIELTVEAAVKAKETIKELKTKYGYVKMCQMGEYQDIPTYYRSFQYDSEKTITEKVTKDVQNHFKALQAKVEKKIGKIINIESLGGWDYRFIGELDNCTVEVILAGGYNIQRLHTRWIISKNR